ncbi:MAG TPA: acetamidase/formamidase family protein [Pelolinea sp.]|nr:acetamidase/formamidase family protein [Pelolinea sp.]
MEKKLSRDHVFYAFSPELEPALKVAQGEEFVLETHDCFSGQLKSEKDLLNALDWDRVNPATGPVFIENVKPGDVLRVDLVKLNVTGHSTMVTMPGEGALGDKITQMETAVLKYKKDRVVFRDKISIPMAPMVGVIGVAPAEGKVPNGEPGAHGGNMDCTLIAEGVSVYFTANVPGALFGCGDFHAVMGDGEIVICGAESPGEICLKAQVMPELKGLPTPFVETLDLLAAVASAGSLDQAGSDATHNMADFLTRFVPLPVNDAGMLMSLVGQLKVCQVVDPQKTARFEFPKWVLKEYGYELPR